jgi:hypothetical protein
MAVTKVPPGLTMPPSQSAVPAKGTSGVPLSWASSMMTSGSTRVSSPATLA